MVVGMSETPIYDQTAQDHGMDPVGDARRQRMESATYWYERAPLHAAPMYPTGAPGTVA